MAAVTILAVGSTLISAAPPVRADQQRIWSPRPAAQQRSVPVSKAGLSSRPAPDAAAPWHVAAVRWPQAARGEVALAPAKASPPGLLVRSAPRSPSPQLAGGPVRVPNAPVWVGLSDTPAGAAGSAGARAASSTATLPDRVEVVTADRAAARRAGADGILFSIRRSDGGTGGRIKAGVGYQDVRGAFSGDWASRVRLAVLPACALTTPDLAQCRVQTPLPSENDPVTGQVTADLDLPSSDPGAGGDAGAGAGKAASPTSAGAAAGSAVVLAATAGPSGSAGSYKATSLAPSGSWSGGGSSGGFSWTYPVTVPPSIGGGAPTVALSYSSASVDGRTAASNGQASWIGDGWDYHPGFIERAYQSCAKAGVPTSSDQCWDKPNATLSMPGRSGELVRDDATGTWRLAGEDGSKVELLTGAANDAWSGEYWVVTSPDGTRSYFGANRLPGGNGTDPASNAAWTSPVYSARAGDPCKAATFAASSCAMAYRWNLDFIVDKHGNLTTFTYTPETNSFLSGQDTPSATLKSYVRGGVPGKISYGWRTSDAASGGKPAAQIVFDTAERCDVDKTFSCDPAQMTAANAAKWPDVPVDQKCAATGTCPSYTPTFWSTKRLRTITTRVLVGAGYKDVDRYTLTQQFSDPGGGTGALLWLKSVQRTGLDQGATTDLPPVAFTAAQMPNRVAGALGIAAPDITRYRMSSINTEAGSTVNISYSPVDCTKDTLPQPDSNTRRCYPVYWAPPGYTTPQLDWFHKYLVTGVTEVDQTTNSPNKVTAYEYIGAAAWHRDTGENTPADSRTWNQFRGYEQVATRTGTAPEPITQSITTYMRGMDGDATAAGGTKSVEVADSGGGSLRDEEMLAGFVREVRVYDGAGGKVTSRTVNDPWLGPVTATHAKPAGLSPLVARKIAVGTERTWALKADGTWRTGRTDNTYEPTSAGRLIQVDDQNDTADPGQRQCTATTFAAASDPMVLDKVSRMLTVAGPCGSTATAANTVGDIRNLYDGAADPGSAGTGDPTGTQVIDHYDDAGAPVYVTKTTQTFDAYGRRTSSTDVATGATTSSTVTPNTGALPTSTRTTTPMGWQETSVLSPGRGLPMEQVDVNGRRTSYAYDGLGRVTSVWAPGRAKATQSASATFTYEVNGAAKPSVIATRTLREDQRYAVQYDILDGYMRLRQTQATPPDDAFGRIVSDTFYDAHGWPVKISQPYFNDRARPEGVLVTAADADVPSQTVTGYDGLGRTISSSLYARGRFQWQSTQAYPGVDRTDSMPPAGGNTTSTFTGADGRTTATWQYKGAAATGDPAEADKVTYAYTPAGQLAQVTDMAGNIWRSEYDLQGRKTKSVDPDSGTATSAYDAAGRLTATTDGRGASVAYAYDKLGRRTGSYLGVTPGDPARQLAGWTYDSLPNGKGLQVAATRYTAGAGGPAYTSEVTGYDALGRVTGSRMVIPSNEGKLAGTYASQTTYTPNIGLVDSVSLPAAGGIPAETLYYAYNANGLTGSIGNSTTYLAEASYTHTGQLARSTLGSAPFQVVQSNTYDEATGRLVSQLTDKQNSPAPVNATGYLRDASGNLTAVSTARGDGTTDTQCFTYDRARRLTEAWTDTGGTTAPTDGGVGGCAHATPAKDRVGGPAPYWQSFSYDAVGNRTGQVNHDPSGDPAKDTTVTETYPTPGTTGPHAVKGATSTTGSLVQGATYTYDGGGNTLTRTGPSGTQTLTWTAEGKVESVSTTGQDPSSYLYDADGNQLIRRSPGKTTLNLGGDEIVLSLATNTVSGTRYYDTAGGPTVARSNNGAITYLGSDDHGTNSLAIDAGTLSVSRRDFKPFGEERGTAPAPGSWPGTKGFVGGTIDITTGLTNVGARQYDPQLGRFISVDPILDATDLQQINAYAYANNNPTTLSDPTGLRPIGTCEPGVACLPPGVSETFTYQGSSMGWTYQKAVEQPTLPNEPNTGAVTVTTVYDVGAKARGYQDYTTTYKYKYPPKPKPKKKSFWDKAKSVVKTVANFAYEMSGVKDIVGCARNPGANMQCLNAGITIVTTVASMGAGGAATAAARTAATTAERDMALAAERSGAKNAAERVAKSCKDSFLPTTEVSLADGTSKPIGDVETGEHVLATDPVTDQTTAQPVTDVIVTRTDKAYTDLTVRTEDGRESAITSTDHHPYWNATTATWTEAASLTPGDHLRQPNGATVTVTATRTYNQTATTYNLTVDKVRTYYVLAGRTPVLVHNTSCPHVNYDGVPEDLRADAKKVIDSLDKDGTLPPGVRQGGTRNQPGIYGGEGLPPQGARYYTESDILPTAPGAKRPPSGRLVTGQQGEIWYTGHYKDGFVQLRGPQCGCFQ